MEDDDEFGDLYTDVLKPFAATTSSSAALPQPPISSRPIDLNLRQSAPAPPAATPNAADDEIPHGPPNLQTLAPVVVNNFDRKDSREHNSAVVPRVSESKLPNDDGKDLNFDIEAEEPVIPGLNPESSRKDDIGGSGEGQGRGDDWDEEEESDSEDDLQIVLNDNNHGPMSAMMDIGGAGMDGGDDDDEDDEDGAPLVIVGDEDAPNPGVGVGMGMATGEEQDWGEDGGQAPDGERKEGGEAASGKPNAAPGGVVIAPKLTYSNHGYHHPFHSQFKYVRPGVATMPGATTVGPGAGPGQVRPPVNMGPIAGRGRGDWRPTGMKGAPSMQKGFHSGFGMPWGNNIAGRGFGGGLEFTLPSHKTIFEVDIDIFEEKPWKCPGVDVTDFFNFGLNEESWKDYCKQLEQHRLETTMQSKIRVYESGRTEQEYDPDLPPELAAAAGMQDISAENANLGKSEIGQTDGTKGSVRVRPPLPTGRAIQVEGGSGERLPSIDTRPPRIRDSDAIIEIIPQDSMDDDSSTRNGAEEQVEPREDLRGDHMTDEDVAPVETEYFDGFPEAYNSQRRELGRRRTQFMGSVQNNIPEGEKILPYPSEAPFNYHPGSRGQPPVYPGGDFGVPYDERRTPERVHGRSPHLPPNRSKQNKKFLDNQDEVSVESMDGKHSPALSSPAASRDARELSAEHKAELQEPVLHDGSSEMDKEEMTTSDTPKDGNLCQSIKKQKISSQVEQPVPQELDDGEDSKAARSSENSKARSGSSRDYQKWRDNGEEEVVQDGRSTRLGSTRKHLDEGEPNFRRKDRDGRQVMERNRMVVKGRDDPFPYRDMDPSLSHHLHVKSESFDRRKERDSADVTWQRRDEDPYSRKSRTEDARKRERADEMGSRHKGKLRENERSDKDEHVYSRKPLDNGNYRVHYEEEVGVRHRERDDSLKSRFEIVDEYHSKRRKDEEYFRRDHAEKEEFLHSHRETTSRRKRERDSVFDLQKRDDHQRVRDNLDDHHSVRHKDEAWLQRERSERQRERDDWHRLKQSHEENLPKREREEGRIAVRSGRGSVDKAWVGHARAKDEYKGTDKDYQLKDMARHSEQLKRRDRAEDGSSSYHRGCEDVYAQGNQINEERKSRQGRSSGRNDRAVNASESQRMHDKKHKESTRKNKESEGGDGNTLASSKRNQDDPSSLMNEMGLKGASEQGNGKNESLVPHNTSRKHKEEASSDEEQQDSRRGRSKFERWMSHKERDYGINSKSSASFKFREIDRNRSGGSSEASKVLEEPAKAMEVDNLHTSAEEKNARVPETRDADPKPLEDKHLDTVEKLKKRSERFKLPMPSDKDTMSIKKVENEAPPPAKSEAPADSEIKQERPARKRRWVGN